MKSTGANTFHTSGSLSRRSKNRKRRSQQIRKTSQRGAERNAGGATSTEDLVRVKISDSRRGKNALSVSLFYSKGHGGKSHEAVSDILFVSQPGWMKLHWVDDFPADFCRIKAPCYDAPVDVYSIFPSSNSCAFTHSGFHLLLTSHLISEAKQPGNSHTPASKPPLFTCRRLCMRICMKGKSCQLQQKTKSVRNGCLSCGKLQIR